MKIRRILWFALLVATPVFTWYLFQHREVLDLLSQLRSPKLVFLFFVATVLLISAHLLRALKTKLLTDSIKITSWRTHTRALFIGYLFNTLLPLRVGEFIRAIVLGKGIKMSASFIFSLVLLDRAIDGFILGGLGLMLLYTTNAFSVPAVHSIIITTSLALLIISTLVIGFLVTLWRQPVWLLRACHRITGLFKDDLRDTLRFKIWSVMYGLERVFKRERLLKYLALSGITWALYLTAILPLSINFLHHLKPKQAIANSTASYLGVAAPAGPSYIGSYQNYVQPFADSYSEATAMHQLLAFAWLLQILPAFLIGLVFVIRTHETLEGPAASKSLRSVEDKLLRDVDISHDLSSFLDAFFTNNSLSCNAPT